MQNYKRLTMAKPCEFCPALVQSEAVAQAYRKAANAVMDYLLELYWLQHEGKFVHIDSDHVADLVDDILSIDGTNGGKDNGAELHDLNGN